MTRLATVIAALALSGCGSVANFHPYVVDILDSGVLERDTADCLSVATAYRLPFNLASIGESAVRGAAANAGAGAINPLVPVAGAAGAVGSATMEELGLNSTAQKRIYLLCLNHRGLRSGAYSVVDPLLLGE